MSEPTSANQKEKSAKIRRKPERESVLRPTFATARQSTTDDEWLQRRSPERGLLQRRCACGRHPIAGGECQECRSQREGTFLQRSSFDPILDNVSAHNPVNDQRFPQSGFSYDFSQVPAHTSKPQPAVQTKLFNDSFGGNNAILQCYDDNQRDAGDPMPVEKFQPPAPQPFQTVQLQSTEASEPQCRVQVRYSRLGGLPLLGSWYHAYALVTKPDGSRYYLRGGPENGSGSSALSSASGGSSSQSSSGSSQSGSSNSSNSSSPGSSPARPGGSTGLFGKIVTEYGSYQPGTVDWETGSPPAVTVFSGPDSGGVCDGYYQAMQRSMDRIESADIPYNPFTQNSNSAAHQAVEDAGLPRPTAPVWAPGSDRRL